jgi:hypothetical protein
MFNYMCGMGPMLTTMVKIKLDIPNWWFRMNEWMDEWISESGHTFPVTTTLHSIKLVNCGPRLVADLNLVQQLEVLELSSIHACCQNCTWNTKKTLTLVCALPRTCQTLKSGLCLECQNPKRDLGFTRKLLLLVVCFLPQQRCCCFRWRRGCGVWWVSCSQRRHLEAAFLTRRKRVFTRVGVVKFYAHALQRLLVCSFLV